MTRTNLSIFIILLGLPQFAAGQTASVTAVRETDPVPHSGDAADDPAIWIHPTEPALSTVIGTDKLGGLVVYDLSGMEIQYLPDGNMNNVSIRYNFPLAGEFVDLVTAGNRSNDSIAVYSVNKTTRMLENVSAATIYAGITVYGSCMYNSASTGQFYFIVNSKLGEVEQWRLSDNGAGKVAGILQRSFDVGGQTEGCVTDDENANLYIGEENVGIWKYGAEPQDSSGRVRVDSVGSTGNLTADVEGLTIYYAGGGSGYLIASSQGSSEYVIYEREEGNSYVGTFDIVAGDNIDGVNDTDGIAVTNYPLNTDFPYGLFVAQDGSNDDGNQNYKLVSWQDIAMSMVPNLVIDIEYDPRVGRINDLSEPTEPGNLSASTVTRTNLTLNWSASDDNVSVTGYRIERDGAVLTITTALNYTDSGLTAGTQYTYTVVALDAAGNESTPASVSVTTQLNGSDDQRRKGGGATSLIDLLLIAMAIVIFRLSRAAMCDFRCVNAGRFHKRSALRARSK